MSKPKTWGDIQKRGRGQSFLICEKDIARALRVHLGYWDAQTLTGLRFVFCSPGFDPQRAHYFYRRNPCVNYSQLALVRCQPAHNGHRKTRRSALVAFLAALCVSAKAIIASISVAYLFLSDGHIPTVRAPWRRRCCGL